ncbi:hypothetical protein [Bradyrhizobium stylosanthis]|uniref:Immunity protein 50 of polymorphic toxin system n=1 Tax=Bradyrhizobium stylosanthis TaxID=1803665 RepID=A0A560DXK1_9BRAD|nr:hypothetical protein [Bradyrhizobium stylosanthis]TWB01872.1 hypothetical protein FBZ96_103654 [Bradyrhizobium stylosanthis]
MADSFNSLPWHDAQLLELTIDRRNPGARDEVRVQVIWPDGGHATLFFRDCYAVTADMNFGINADELILSASLIEDDPGLASIRNKWGPRGVTLEMLRCYRLETSSTASVLRIYAERFEVA